MFLWTKQRASRFLVHFFVLWRPHSRQRRETSQCEVLWRTWTYQDEFFFCILNSNKFLRNPRPGISRIALTNWEGPNHETQLSLKRLQINFFSRLFHRGRLRRCLSSLLYILFYLLKQLWLKEEITTISTNFTDKWQKKKRLRRRVSWAVLVQ